MFYILFCFKFSFKTLKFSFDIFGLKRNTIFVLTFNNVIRDSSITIISIRCENKQDRIDWIDALKYAFHKSNFVMNLNQRDDIDTNILRSDINDILVGRSYFKIIVYIMHTVTLQN